jgi:hypothetical protein
MFFHDSKFNEWIIQATEHPERLTGRRENCRNSPYSDVSECMDYQGGTFWLGASWQAQW